MADGYDPLFLSSPVPLPTPARNPIRLDYPHFSVLLDTHRRLAVATAVNIDGADLRDVPRFGDWSLDDRVPASDQAGPELYSSNDLDRGHLVRRRDPGWGDEAVARAATEATFRYPNAAPQASVFNQSKDLWLGLEDHVLGYAETTDQRLSVFTSPVLAADDPLYRGIRIPLRFWKVAAWASPVGLRSAGFILDQTDLVRLSDDAAAVPPLGAFKTFQVPVGDVERISGVSLGELVATDTISQNIRAVPWLELGTTNDIVL